MRISTPSAASTTARAVLAIAGSTFLLTTMLYLNGGCAGSATPAREQTAIKAYVQGVLAYQKGDTDKAVADLQEAVNIKGDLVMARSMLGDLYRARANYEGAREQYEVASRLDPYDYVHHFQLGLALQFLQRFQEAAVSYLKALDLRPDDPPSNMYLGTIYMVLVVNDNGTMSPADAAFLRQKAVHYAERATQLDPKSTAAWANFAVVLDSDRQFARAESAYRKALDLDASQTLLELYLGENLIQQRKFAEARSVLSELVKIQDTKLHRLRLGDAYAGEKKYDDAMIQYHAALKHDANYYQAFNKIAEVNIVQYQAGLGLNDEQRKAAIDAWQQSLSINRLQPEVAQSYAKWVKAPAF
jgi:tetratricopeptide (TPR) repeat protein